MNNEVLKEALRRDAVRARKYGGGGIVRRSLEGGAPATDTGSSEFFYKRLAESEIRGDRVRAGIEMLELCMRRLKVKVIRLAWFYLCGPRDPGAMPLGSQPTKAFVQLRGEPVVWLRADLSPDDIRLAAAHEAHHVWMEGQPKDRYATLNADDRESSANAFSLIMYRELQDLRRSTADWESKNWG